MSDLPPSRGSETGPADGGRQALAEKRERERDELDAVLAQMATDDGELTEEDLAWVQRVLAR